MAYTGRHSYFLCFLQFVFRRSPARLAVKNTLTRSVRKIFHEQPARRAALRDRPEKQLSLPQEMRMTDCVTFIRKSFCYFHLMMYFRECLLHFRKQTGNGRIFEISGRGNQWHRRRNGHGNGLFLESGHFGNRKRAGSIIRFL